MAVSLSSDTFAVILTISKTFRMAKECKRLGIKGSLSHLILRDGRAFLNAWENAQLMSFLCRDTLLSVRFVPFPSVKTSLGQYIDCRSCLTTTTVLFLCANFVSEASSLTRQVLSLLFPRQISFPVGFSLL